MVDKCIQWQMSENFKMYLQVSSWVYCYCCLSEDHVESLMDFLTSIIFLISTFRSHEPFAISANPAVYWPR